MTTQPCGRCCRYDERHVQPTRREAPEITMTTPANAAAPTGLAGTTGWASDLERENAHLKKELRFARRLLEVNAQIEAGFVDGSSEKMVAEIARLTVENEFLQALLAGFEWRRINTMDIAEVEKELFAAGHTRESLDAGIAKIRAMVDAASKREPNIKVSDAQRSD